MHENNSSHICAPMRNQAECNLLYWSERRKVWFTSCISKVTEHITDHASSSYMTHHLRLSQCEILDPSTIHSVTVYLDYSHIVVEIRKHEHYKLKHCYLECLNSTPVLIPVEMDVQHNYKPGTNFRHSIGITKNLSMNRNIGMRYFMVEQKLAILSGWIRQRKRKSCNALKDYSILVSR